jgi:peroxiredoxin/Skp family chaperone for outer membrane proteins
VNYSFRLVLAAGCGLLIYIQPKAGWFMKKFVFTALIAVILATTGPSTVAADATVELKALVGKIRDDMADGKTNASDLADDLKQFDELLARHPGEKTDAVASIVYMKAMLYDQRLHDPAKAAELIKQLKVDFQGTEFVAELEKREAAELAAHNIRAALVVGTKFPDFNEKDLSGKPLSLANHRGKVVLLDFWATSSASCRAELPFVMSAYNKYHDQGFEIIGISLDQDQAKFTEFTQAMGLAWAQYFDGQGWQNKLAVKYGVEKIPATYLLDREGKIIGKDLRGEALPAAVGKAQGMK